VGRPERGLLLVASTPVPNLKVPPEDLPRLLDRRLSEIALPSLGDPGGVRAVSEEGALWAAEAGLVEEEDLPHLTHPLGTAPGDPDSLGRRALLAGARDWTRPGRVEAFRVAEVLDPDGAGSLGLEPEALVLVVLAGAEDLGRLALAAHAERVSGRLSAGADFGSTPDLPAAPLDSEEARDLLAASAAAANYAAARTALLLHALRRALRDLAGSLEGRAGWAIGGLANSNGTAVHRNGLAALGEGEALSAGGVVAVGMGAMRGSAPPFGASTTDDGRWPWEEAGLLARWAALELVIPRARG
jgi:tRNA-splicing ligase RtcB